MNQKLPPVENYESFRDRCEVLFLHRDVVLISIAYKLGKFSHRHQERKDELGPDGESLRYWEHLRRVALVLMDEALLADRDLIIEALLHDAVEDTRLSTEEINLVFGAPVSQGILLMTKKPKQGFIERLRTYGTWRELAVKIADRTDNLRSLENSSVEFRVKQTEETHAIYLPLADLLLERVKEESTPVQEGCVRLVRLLREALWAVPT